MTKTISEQTSKTRLDLLEAEFQASVKSGKGPAAKEVSEAVKAWQAAQAKIKKAENDLEKARAAATETIEQLVRVRGRKGFTLGEMRYQVVCRDNAVFLREFGAKEIDKLDELIK